MAGVTLSDCTAASWLASFFEKALVSRVRAHRHPHGEVLPLNVARADVLRIGVAGDLMATDTDALSRAVSRLSLWRGAVQLLQNRESQHRRRKMLG